MSPLYVTSGSHTMAPACGSCSHRISVRSLTACGGTMNPGSAAAARLTDPVTAFVGAVATTLIQLKPYDRSVQRNCRARQSVSGNLVHSRSNISFT